MGIVPNKFNIEHGEDLSSLLDKHVSNGIVSVKWKDFNIEIFFSDTERNSYWPEIEDIKKHTPDFLFYENFGFTVGKYSEFLVYAEDWDYLPDTYLTDGSGVEISIGEVSPIGYYIFDINHDNNLHADLREYCKSIRIFGAMPQDVELYLLNGLNKLIFELGFSFDFYSLDSNYYDEDEDDREKDVIIEKKFTVNKDILPNRLFYKGIKESDNSNAFLDFYRILEYYSVIIAENDVDKLRCNPNVSKRSFIIEMNKIISDNERALLGRLISKIANPKILVFCEQKGLIDKNKADLLSNQIYEFRNSLVHSKSNQKSLPFAKSIFIREESLENWTFVCKELAYICITKL